MDALIADPTSPEPPFIQKVRLTLQHLISTNEINDIMANTQTKSSSFYAQVLDLAPGESCSRVRAVDPTTSVERLPEELPEIKQQLRNACTPAVTNAKEKTGGTYSIEVGEVVMPKGRMYVLAVVTRNHE